MTTSASPASTKDAEAFRTIGEVAEALKVPQHVLRFWETRFVQIKPMKRAGNRRFYRPQDVELVSAIRQLLYGEGYTIKGVQRLLREQGPRGVATLARRPGGVSRAPDASGIAAEEPGGSELDVATSEQDMLDLLRLAREDLAECRRILVASGA